MKYMVAAYTLAPSGVAWNQELESKYYAGLKALDHVRGIEVPAMGSLHPYDDEWFINNVDPAWDFVFTGMPGVMAGIGKGAQFGIASDDSSGRVEAIAFYHRIQQMVLKLNGALGREAVESVQLHTAPNRKHASASAAALCESLKEMLAWNWGGAKLVIEHCDAMLGEQDVQKGFLTLDEEIEAISSVNAELGARIGLAINWGRSAIEARSVEGPLQHIEKAKQAGLLYGLTFSGASNQETPYGVWKDTHMPPAKAFGIEFYAEKSLLTEHEVARSLAAAEVSNLPFLGIKIGARSSHDLTIDERVGYNRDALEVIDQVCLAKGGKGPL